MDEPKRIQLSRAKGWRMPPGAVKVDRTTKWGNPFRVVRGTYRPDDNRKRSYRVIDSANAEEWEVCERYERVDALRIALSCFEHSLELDEFDTIRRELRGKDLACWCPLCPQHAAGKPFGFECADCAPCHADTLGKVANG